MYPSEKKNTHTHSKALEGMIYKKTSFLKWVTEATLCKICY